MIKFLSPNKEFHESLVKYKSIDTLLAIGLFLIMCMLYAILAILDTQYPILKENSIIVGIGFNILMVVLTFIMIKIRKEKLSSIGLYNGKWKQSCFIGFMIAGFLFFTNCLSHIMEGANFIGVNDIVMLIIYYFTVALCEEVVFRGYIGTRLYGVIKNQYLVILISGILFVFMHFPYRMIAYGMTISDLAIYNLGWLIDLFITHTVLTVIYMKTNSLYGSIIPHWMSNLAYNLIDR
ncbi:MAG: CPBP family intramembrane glutamic endopeptidase [Coprobacillus sp.]